MPLIVLLHLVAICSGRRLLFRLGLRNVGVQILGIQILLHHVLARWVLIQVLHSMGVLLLVSLTVL